MRPWYAGVVLTEAVIRNAGYDASSGVENVLRPEARRDGKEIRFLESVEDQMSSFATLPEDVQVRFLVEGLEDIDGAGKGLSELVNAWKSGNLDDLKRVLIDEDMAHPGHVRRPPDQPERQLDTHDRYADEVGERNVPDCRRSGAPAG